MHAALLIEGRTQMSYFRTYSGYFTPIAWARRAFYTCGSASNKCRSRFFTIYQVTCVGTCVRCKKSSVSDLKQTYIN